MIAYADRVADAFDDVNRLILDQLHSTVGLVEDISQYLVSAGGKRIRPRVTLLCAGALNALTDSRQITLAAVIEFLHTATLLHDDVVDMSTLRRGKPTANANWGNASSVLVGDFVYSRAFEMMVSMGSLEVMSILSQTTTKIAEGEVQQLDNIAKLSMSEDEYFAVIEKKTAQLFQGACESTAVLAGTPPEQRLALRSFGRHLGIAFQLIDDYLDYQGDASALGKNVGDDLAEGKLTLPLIHALHQASDQDRQFLSDVIREKNVSALPEVLALVNSTGGLRRTVAAAQEHAEHAKQALTALAPSPHATALRQLVDTNLARTS
ncbi:octaprenyl diphosphate synthase [bacterium]|nr:octaprenyl diphosphate synthase [bacterium]